MKRRLDQTVTGRGLTTSRSQAESYIRLGLVTVNKQVVTKPGTMVVDTDKIELKVELQYVSRAGLKLASVAEVLKLDFKDKLVLDVGSSTGGFTDYVLKHGAKKVIAVDVGTDQMHPSLRDNPSIELHEKTDIRGFETPVAPDIVVIDVSFISLRQILPTVADLSGSHSQIVAMVKPQFETGRDQVSKGVIKNNTVRRQILKDFENWAKQRFAVRVKADSQVRGATGNQERFYLLTKLGF